MIYGNNFASEVYMCDNHHRIVSCMETNITDNFEVILMNIFQVVAILVKKNLIQR